MKPYDLNMKAAEIMDWKLKVEDGAYVAPDYIKDLNATMELALHLQNQGYQLVVEFPITKNTEFTVRALKHVDEHNWDWTSMRSKTLSEAITKLTLLLLT